jgi:hypothetical protein
MLRCLFAMPTIRTSCYVPQDRNERRDGAICSCLATLLGQHEGVLETIRISRIIEAPAQGIANMYVIPAEHGRVVVTGPWLLEEAFRMSRLMTVGVEMPSVLRIHSYFKSPTSVLILHHCQRCHLPDITHGGTMRGLHVREHHASLLVFLQ